MSWLASSMCVFKRESVGEKERENYPYSISEVWTSFEGI